jgi:two-component system, OmpR family, sensor histidine kinase MprB
MVGMQSLRGRLALLLAGLAGLTALAVGAVGYRLTANRFTGEIRGSLDRLANEIQADRSPVAGRACNFNRRDQRNPAAQPPPSTGNSSPAEESPTGPPPGDDGRPNFRRRVGTPAIITQCLGPTGEVTVASLLGALPVSANDRKLASAKKPDRNARRVTYDGRTYRLVTVGLAGGGAVQLAREVGENDRLLGGLLWEILGLVLGASVLAGIAGLIVARHTARPLQALAETAETIAQTGELDVQLPTTSSTDETGRLTRSFGSMVDALRTSKAQQSQLVHDASHELRTPLTSLRANISLLRRHPELPQEQRLGIVASLNDELSELTDLVNELVSLAGDETTHEPVQEFSPAEVVEDSVQRWARRSGRVITFTETSSSSGDSESSGTRGRATIEGRPKLFGRAISNLISNAVKFSPTEEPVSVSLDLDTHRLRVVVDDTGPGFTPGEEQRVFDRFFRSDVHRTLPGSGLGLAIVAAAAADGGGSAAASNTDIGGRVVFELPRSRP